jgi:glycosyltransferase involved in cell wall biosynthesis
MKISVILPNYNHASLVGQSIEGVLKQSYGDIELIVVDDGSTDHSRQIIENYAENTRVKAVFLEVNSGVNAALAAGLRLASGELYFGAGADDYLCDPDFFGIAVEMMKARPSAAGVFARSRVISKNNDEFLWAIGYAPREGFVAGQEFLDLFLRHQSFIPGSSVLLRLDLLKNIGGFDPTLGPQADYFVNHAFAAVYGVFFLNRDVAAFRVAPTTYSAKATDKEYFTCHALMEKKLRDYAGKRRFDPRLLRFWRDGIINGRFNLKKCNELYEALLFFSEGAPLWEKKSTPKEFLEVVETATTALQPLKKRLDLNVLEAHSIFDEIAGSLNEQDIGMAIKLKELVKKIPWRT